MQVFVAFRLIERDEIRFSIMYTYRMSIQLNFYNESFYDRIYRN